MTFKAHLVIELPPKFSEALEKALKPDNEVLPKGFEIRTYVDFEGFHLMLEGVCEVSPSAILTTLSILDEVTQLAKSLVRTLSKSGDC